MLNDDIIKALKQANAKIKGIELITQNEPTVSAMINGRMLFITSRLEIQTIQTMADEEIIPCNLQLRPHGITVLRTGNEIYIVIKTTI